MRRVLAGAGAALSAAALAVLVASVGPGCTTHPCDSSSVDSGAVGTSFRNGTEMVWESSPASGPWLTFAGNATLNLAFPQPFGGDPTELLAWVATDPGTPDASPGNSTSASGQLAEFTHFSSTGLTVLNSTCQTYYLRLTARGPATSVEAGADAAGGE